MREILFRGKCKIDGGWVYGCLFHNKEKTKFYIRTDTDDYSVNIESIGQYTGITDKNGKKIFEHDIVKTPSDEDNIFVVRFIDCGFQLVGKCISYVMQDFFEGLTEIVGNIHDNPELFKELSK